MGRMTEAPQFHLVHACTTVVESSVDLLHLLQRSRALAKARLESYDIRNESNVILAITLSPKKADGGIAMSRAAKHNAQIAAAARDVPDPPKCPATDFPHVWRKYSGKAVGVEDILMCADCKVFGSKRNSQQMRTCRCSTCGKPATRMRAGKRVFQHRWSCEAHVHL